MFGPPWGRDPHEPFDPTAFNRYLFRRAQDPRSRPGQYPDPPRSFPIPIPPPDAYTSYPKPLPRSLKLPKLPKHTRFSDPESPLSSDYAASDWDDTYSLDTDRSFGPPPPFTPQTRRPRSPELDKISATVPRAVADELRLRSNKTLLLPPLVHLRICVSLPHDERAALRAAAPGTMAFGDVAGQVVRCYAGKGVMYSARVEQRGRMCEVARDAVLGDLAHRGEVYREGWREIRVEIVVGGDEGWSGGRREFGLGPRGGEEDAEVETVRKREFSRTRYARRR